MSSSLNLPQGLLCLTGVPEISKYFNKNNLPYSDINEVLTERIKPIRHIGLTVNINGVEYWFKNGIEDSDLIIKLDLSNNVDKYNLVAFSDIVPDASTFSEYDKYYNSTDNKIYVNISNTWENPISPIAGILYIFNNFNYLWDGEKLIKPGDNIPTQPTLTSDINVNLSGGRFFGKYSSGSVIPAIGKTMEEVLRDIALESINPTASITASGNISFNVTSGSISINMNALSNNPGGTITNIVLSYRRGNGEWVQIYTGVMKTTHTHIIDSLLVIDNKINFSYLLNVTDSTGCITSAISNTITPAGYSAPTCSINVSGPTRELGNISTTINGNISQLGQNGVSIVSRTLQYSLNSSTWINISTFDTNEISFTHDDNLLINATNIYYRIVVVVSVIGVNTTTNLGIGNVNFVYRSFFGYSVETSPVLSTILGFGNSVLTNSKSKTIVATAPANNYTYYAYCASAGDLTGIVMDGVFAVLGAFTKLSDITGLNNFGATVTYRIYKSNAPQAFTNNQLVIS